MNKVMLEGNVRSIKIQEVTTRNGKNVVCNVLLKVGNQNVKITYWGSMARKVYQEVGEGDSLTVTGELDYPDAWEKEGRMLATNKVKPMVTKLYGHIIRPMKTETMVEVAQRMSQIPNVDPITGEVDEVPF